MAILRRFRLWLRALFARWHVEREMTLEMQFHVEMETERNLSLGFPPEEARRRAMAEFGGVERFKEDVRAERGTGWLDALWTELRIAVRTLAKRPAFTALVVVTIAIGIGATTAVYSWAEWVLFRPVPGVRDPGALVTIQFLDQLPHGGMSMTGISYPNFVDLAATTRSFSGITAFGQPEAQVAAPGIEPTAIQATVVVGDYFRVLGVIPPLGRAFSARELEPSSQARVTVISDSLWRAGFGGRRNVLGRSLDVNGIEFAIIGVAPPQFHGISRGNHTDLWLPAAAYPIVSHQPGDISDRHYTAFMEIVGRLRPGVTPQQAQDETNRRMNILVAEFPGINDIYKDCHAVVGADIGMPTYARKYLANTVDLLLGIVALVLLITAANVANLLLLRGVRRREEVAVRRALGASPARIVGQHLVDGLLLSFAGGLAGLAVGALILRSFSLATTTRLIPTEPHLVLDRRVLIVAVALCVGTGLVFGLAPGLAALRHDPADHLKNGTRGSRHRSPVRAGLTITQIGAAMALVVGALLLGRTLYNIAHVDLGFDPNDVSLFFINARPQGYAPARVEQLRKNVLEQTAALPGVQAAGIASYLPAMGFMMGESVRPRGDSSRAHAVNVADFTVSSGFFEAIRLPILRGRAFTPDEFDSPHSDAAVVSTATARALFGPGDPVGREFDIGSVRRPDVRTVIGVAADVPLRSPEDASRLAVYVPAATAMYAPMMNPAFELVVRSRRSPADLQHDIRRLVGAVAPDLPVPVPQSYAGAMRAASADSYLFARLVGVLAALAALLATVGLYSVVAFAVAERTREIGIRVALGAREANVVGLVVRQSALLTIIGLLAGTAGAVALAHFLASRLFGVTPLDPMTYVAGAILWALLATLASFVPARAAARINPVEALRYE